MTKYFPVLKYVNIPNIITSISICIGIISFIMFKQENYKIGIVLYAFTLLFDRIDGIIARKLNAQTDFGAELDSFSDSINFCVIPALITYFIGFDNVIAVCILFIYVLSGVWRLANFNLNGLVKVGNKDCFTGLCTTHSAALFLISITIYLSFFKDGRLYFMYLLFAVTAILMNSSFKYSKNGWLTKTLTVLVPITVVMSFIVNF